MAVAAHVRTLLVEHGPEPDDKADFIADAREMVEAAFMDPTDPAVLVCIVTASGDTGLAQSKELTALAEQYRPVIDHSAL